MFFLFLCAISFLSKLFTKDALILYEKYDSYFIDLNKEMNKESSKKVR